MSGEPDRRADPATLTYPPQVLSVRLARRSVEAALAGTPVEHLADDAGLLVSELAANAVLHARTDFDVVVDVGEGRVRVHVRDRSDDVPVLAVPSATGMSGRGLALVSTLASAWGTEAAPEGGKSVWFELTGSAAVVDVELTVEELLAAWADAADDLPPPPAARSEVLVPDLPARDLLSAKEHMDDLLRELQLLLLGVAGPHEVVEGAGRTVGEVAVAERLDRAARAFDAVRRQVREQVGRAVAGGEDRVALRLQVLPGTAARAAEYRAAVEAAEGLALRGELLTGGDVRGRHALVRGAYLDAVIAGPQD